MEASADVRMVLVGANCSVDAWLPPGNRSRIFLL